MTTGAAPDYIEPVVGWRAWSVEMHGAAAWLHGVVRAAPWPPGAAAVAGCDQLALGHVAPWPGCRCGLHAVREPAEAAFYAGLPSRLEACPAIGRVLLWGTVVEGERGWRASHGYPAEINLPLRRDADATLLADLAGALVAYRCPVRVIDVRDSDLVEALQPAATP